MAKPQSAEMSRPRVAADLQNSVMRVSIKVCFVVLGYLWTVYPLIFQDPSGKVWNVVERLGSSAWVVIPEMTASSLLISAIWFPRLRFWAAVVFGAVLGSIAMVPFQGVYSWSLIGIAALCVPLAAIGVEPVE